MKNFELLRYLKKWWFLIVIVTALGCWGVYQFVADNQQYTATAVIQYTNKDAEQGLNVDGSKIDTSEITSATVINRTIEQLGLSANTESIRSKISVKEVVSDDEELRKETAIQDGEEYTYHPTIYQVSFSVDSKDAENYARNVLDAVLGNYFQYYGEKHIDTDLFPNNAVNVSVDNYEYIDCVEMLQSNADESVAYLRKKADETYGFYSVKTGYSFSDLATSYEYLENNRLSDLYAYIISHKLVTNRNVLVDKKQNDILQCQIQNQSLSDNIAEERAIIDQFGEKTIEGAAIDPSRSSDSSDSSTTEIITDVAKGWESSSIEGERDVTTTYDKLITHYADLQSKLIDVTNKEAQTQEILDVYREAEADTDPNSTEAKWAKNRIDEVADQFNQLYAVAVDTIAEYNQINGADNIAMKCSIVVSQKLNLKMYQMLAVVLFLFVGCFLAMFLGRLGDFVDYYLFVDKKTGLPNRERCDDMIEHYGTDKLKERFAFMTIQLDLVSLDRSEGDDALHIMGVCLRQVFRAIAFVGYNGAGQFMVMMENNSVEFTEVCINRLRNSIRKSEFSNLLEYLYVGTANSTEDGIYEIRSLLRMAMHRCNNVRKQEKEKREAAQQKENDT